MQCFSNDAKGMDTDVLHQKELTFVVCTLEKSKLLTKDVGQLRVSKKGCQFQPSEAKVHIHSLDRRKDGRTSARHSGHHRARDAYAGENVEILPFAQRARFHERHGCVFVIKTLLLIFCKSSRRRGAERAEPFLHFLFVSLAMREAFLR